MNIDFQRAAEESRHEAGLNIIAAIGAQIAKLRAEITELKAEMDNRFTRLEAATETRFAEIKSEIKAQTARIDGQNSRIDILQRVIWPLIGLLATIVFGPLYKALTG